MVQSLFAEPVGEEAEVANSDEATGERMHQEAPDELAAGKLHRFALLAVGVVFVLKADLAVFEFQQAEAPSLIELLGDAIDPPPKPNLSDDSNPELF